jgi:hypothetical protein
MWLRLIFAIALAGGVAALDAAAVTKQQADSMAEKIEAIEQYGSQGARSGTRRRTPMSESELNSWLVYHAPPLLPAGVTQPRLTIADNRTVVGVMVVDLDAVARSRASGRSFDIWNLVGGQVPVTVTGVIHTAAGRGRFELQSADLSGVPVPPRVVQELVDYYSRTADHPDGVRLDAEYALPVGIQEIELTRGAAVVVQ